MVSAKAHVEPYIPLAGTHVLDTASQWNIGLNIIEHSSTQAGNLQ